MFDEHMLALTAHAAPTVCTDEERATGHNDAATGSLSGKVTCSANSGARIRPKRTDAVVVESGEKRQRVGRTPHG